MSNFVMSVQYKGSNLNKQKGLLDAAVLEQYNQVITIATKKYSIAFRLTLCSHFSSIASKLIAALSQARKWECIPFCTSAVRQQQELRKC